MSERMLRNQSVIEEFRARNGVVGGDFAGVPLLLLTTTGARTGVERTMPMTYLAEGGGLVVFAANGGRPHHPGWYHNLLAAPEARVEIGAEAYAVTATVLHGEQRRRLWDRQLLRTPYFAGFQERAVREIPVILLTPVAASAPAAARARASVPAAGSGSGSGSEPGATASGPPAPTA